MRKVALAAGGALATAGVFIISVLVAVTVTVILLE
jgi:hypothetical protein